MCLLIKYATCVCAFNKHLWCKIVVDYKRISTIDGRLLTYFYKSNLHTSKLNKKILKRCSY